jgi:hypothetical protein
MKRLKNWLIKHLFKAITVDEVLTSNKYGLIYLNGEQITDEEARILHNEAIFLKEFRLWQILQSTIADHAKKRMFENSKSYEDMIAGKMALYNADIQNKIIEILINKKFK